MKGLVKVILLSYLIEQDVFVLSGKLTNRTLTQSTERVLNLHFLLVFFKSFKSDIIYSTVVIIVIIRELNIENLRQTHSCTRLF